MRVHSVVTLLTAALAACCDPLVVRDDVSVRVRADGLQVQNRGTAPLHVAAVDRCAGVVVDMNFCSRPEQCANAVQPGAALVLPGSSIIGWGTSPDVRVWVWRLLPQADGGYRTEFVFDEVVRVSAWGRPWSGCPAT